MTTTRRGAVFGTLSAPFLTKQARAQSMPQRAVRILVPFPPGGAADITARLMAEYMAPLLGQTVIIENRPGAGGNIAAEAVARAAPDGTTLFLGGATIYLANRHLYRSAMPFDTFRDFAHLSRVSVGTTLLVVNANRPWRTFAELVTAARAAPGRIVMGSSGQGTISHLSLSKLMQSASIDITHSPYRGLAPGLNDLLAGNVDMMFDGIPALVPHVREGRLRALAVGSQQRVSYVPGLESVPGMAELLPGSGMDMEFWYSIDAPSGTPTPIVNQLYRAVIAAARRIEYRERLMPLGFTPVTDDSPQAFLAFLRHQAPVWEDLVRVSGARLD